jgi:pantothenate kinase
MTDMPALIERAKTLASSGGRRLLGITGAPGVGKSTVAEHLVAALGVHAVLVPMDGFHLADAELVRLGRRDRKGSVDTFDADGFVALLRRLRDPAETLVYAPRFRREIEDAIAGAIGIPATVPLVVVEGNYLLVPDGGWAPVRGLVDEVWYLDVNEDVRHERLVRRHVEFGKDEEAARAWSLGSDQRNADLIARTRSRADLVVTIR